MLTVNVDGRQLYIAKGSTLQMEMNNTAFSTEKIPGDIMFTFDVPAEENDIIFQHARFVYVRRCKKFTAQILIGGVEIAIGDLYLQKVTRTTYSCGLVINPFPADFAEAKLCENDYGDDIVICHHSSYQRNGFIAFLQNSLREDSVIKFPLFLDTDFYGSGNDDFGWYCLESDVIDDDHTSGYQASLQTNDSMGLDRCYLNRLSINPDNGQIIVDGSGRGVRIFNNQLAAGLRRGAANSLGDGEQREVVARQDDLSVQRGQQHHNGRHRVCKRYCQSLVP